MADALKKPLSVRGGVGVGKFLTTFTLAFARSVPTPGPTLEREGWL